MSFSYTTNSLEDFYFLVGILIFLGFDLDLCYMRTYQATHSDFLIVVRGDE